MKAQSIWILRNRANLRIVTALLGGTEYKYLSAADLSDTTHVIVDRSGVGPYVAKILDVEFVRPEHLYVDFEYKFVIGKIAYLSDEVRERHDREVQEIKGETDVQELARLDAAFGAQGDAPGPGDTPPWTWVESKKRWARGPYAIMADILRTYDRGHTGANATDLVKDLFACVGEDVARAKFAPAPLEPEPHKWTWNNASANWCRWMHPAHGSVYASTFLEFDSGGSDDRTCCAVRDLFSCVGEDVARAKFAPVWVETNEPPVWTWVDNKPGHEYWRADGWRVGKKSIQAYDADQAAGAGEVNRDLAIRDLFSCVGEDAARAKFAPAHLVWTWDKTTEFWPDRPGHWRRGDNAFVTANSLFRYDTGGINEAGRLREIVRDLFDSVGEGVARAKFVPADEPVAPAQDDTRAKFAPADEPVAPEPPVWTWADRYRRWESSEGKCVFLASIRAYDEDQAAGEVGRDLAAVRDLFATVGEDVARAKFGLGS